VASTLACALCPETTPPPDAVIGYRPAGSGPGWPILAHLVCAAQSGVTVVSEWTAADTEELARAWTGGTP
jgi:hypothetical protein